MPEQPEVYNPREAAFKLIEELIEKMDYVGTGNSSRAAAQEQREDESRLAAIKAAFAAEAPADATKLFFLSASAGEYDDFREWPVANYRDYDTAQRDAELAVQQQKAYAKARRKEDKRHDDAVTKLQREYGRNSDRDAYNEAFGTLWEQHQARLKELVAAHLIIDPDAESYVFHEINYAVSELPLR